MRKNDTESPAVGGCPLAQAAQSTQPESAKRQKRGQALIIALIFIVLCTILAIAFFTNVTTAGLGERAMVSEATSSQLALTAVQLMEGTIGYATESGTYPTVAWACQPGMIRTYGGPPAGGGSPATANLQASAAPLAYYKLYSSTNMIVTGLTATGAAQLNNPAAIFAADVPSNWDQNKAFFTDLNSPITSGNATVFPIVDPRAADSDIAVGGFSFANSMPGASGTIDGINTSGTANTYANDTTSRLPMPVAWMYVLRNGSLTTPDTGSGNSAQWSSSASNPPSSSNPIVGRVAFWTDDESSKVNINTASEGTYWDTPVTNSGNLTDVFTSGTVPLGDDVLATIMPVQHEYQRYPGHPATTCLSAVFGTILNSSAYGDAANRAQMVKSITDTIPRVSDYGSGVTGYNAPLGSANTTLGGTQPVTNGTSVTVDQDRLYASLDEYQFSPYYSGTTGASGTGTRIAQTFLSNATQSGSNEAENYVDTCRFFLTAHSKAPELNMFGLPRVAMWPLWDTTNQQKGSAAYTNFDSEILRCSTLNTSGTDNNPHIMAFFRYDPTSPNNDFPAGTTGTAANVNRNPVVFSYLQQLMRTNVPGYGFSFSASSKYSTAAAAATNGVNDCDQILTEIFDYIRCTNLSDISPGATPYTAGTAGSNTSSNVNQAGVGQVVPIRIPSTTSGTAQGLGRIAEIGELALALVKVDDRNVTSGSTAYEYISGTSNYASKITVTGYPGYSNGTPAPSTITVTPSNQTLLEWALIPRIVSPMCGYPALANNIRIQFTKINLNFISASGSQVQVLTGSPNISDVYDTGRISNGRDAVVGGTIGPEALIEPGGSPSAPVASLYPTGLVTVSGTSCVSSVGSGTNTSIVSTSGSNNALTISGTVAVAIESPGVVLGSGTSGTPGPVITTGTFIFTSGTVPMPLLWGPSFSYSLVTSGTPAVVTGTTYNYGTSWNGTYRCVGDPPPSGTVSYVGGANATFTYPALPLTPTYKNNIYRYGNAWKEYEGSSSDVFRSLSPTGPILSNTIPIQGDERLLAISPLISSTTYSMTLTSSGSLPNLTNFTATAMRFGNGIINIDNAGHGTLIAGTKEGSYQGNDSPEVPPMASSTQIVTPFSANPGGQGDWDNGIGLLPDGPWANKPDEGSNPGGTTFSSTAYIGNYQSDAVSAASTVTFYSPNRQVSSPVMFGSLPVGPDHPWRTLLFRPAVLPGYQNESSTNVHPGNPNEAATLPDHLLLDLFWMPVVEPYGISEPLATSGKINLNYQVAPFNYITRKTGMEAVLKSVMITALNPSSGNFIANYKIGLSTGYSTPNLSPQATTRYPIDPNLTLSQFDTRFATQLSSPYSAATRNFFVSATEICDVPLIPLNYPGVTGTSTLSTFWTANALTGDNSLERPYSLIYPRVTTKSNIFTVHVIAQSLKQTLADLSNGVNGNGTWTENVDQVMSEFHGAFTIEKYYDPDTTDITTVSLGKFKAYPAASDGTLNTTEAIRGAKWRLLSVKRFGQ